MVVEMDIQSCLGRAPVILSEAAICERLRRMDGVDLHPTLFNAPLIYETASAELMAGLYREYIEIARSMGVPVLIAAPTWRLDREKVSEAGVPLDINAEAVAYIQKVRRESGYEDVIIAGLMAAKNDSYDFRVGLGVDEAENFHSVQAGQLAASGVDCLIAQTIPSVEEAEGMARAMLATGCPSVIGFCINSQGCVLDGTPLEQAIERLDQRLDGQLLGFMINCSHPTFVPAGSMSLAAMARLIGISANASSKDHCALEEATESVVDSVDEWADVMVRLNHEHGVKILGGCCGTDSGHLQAICDRM